MFISMREPIAKNGKVSRLNIDSTKKLYSFGMGDDIKFENDILLPLDYINKYIKWAKESGYHKVDVLERQNWHFETF